MLLEPQKNQIIEATVASIEPYGIWLQWHEWRGLIRIIDVNWVKKTPTNLNDYVAVGKPVRAVVLFRIDDKKQFVASIKHLKPEENPWRDPDIYAIGAVFEGEILIKYDYGDMLLLETGALAWTHRASTLSDLNVGDKAYYRVTKVNPDKEAIACELAPQK